MKKKNPFIYCDTFMHNIYSAKLSLVGTHVSWMALEMARTRMKFSLHTKSMNINIPNLYSHLNMTLLALENFYSIFNSICRFLGMIAERVILHTAGLLPNAEQLFL